MGGVGIQEIFNNIINMVFNDYITEAKEKYEISNRL